MSDISKAVESLRNPTRLISEERESVIVYKDDLETVLDRLAELEAKERGSLIDRECQLLVGDEVEILINWTTIEQGTRGTVEDIIYEEEYQYKVAVPEQGTIGYRRTELGKVVG